MSPSWLLLAAAALNLASGHDPNADRVLGLTDDNWRDALRGEWMIKFYAPWCPACRNLEANWVALAEYTTDLELDGVAEVDITEFPALSGRFLITALPTIFHVKDGVFRQYRGPRDKEALISFVEDKKYLEAEEVAKWKHPDTFQMAVVGYFFKLSMVLRHVHVLITEDYGYPYWVSYLVFTVCTIVLGGVMGLLLVCLVDMCCPNIAPKGRMAENVYAQRKKNDDLVAPSEDEEDEDEEEDDEDEKPRKESEGDGGEKVVRKRRAKKAE